MSKSLGNVLDPFAGDRALRHRRAALLLLARGLASARTAGLDRPASRTRYDAELANDYGNLASRTLAMIARYRDGRVPDAPTAAALGADSTGSPRGARRCSTASS